MVYGELGFKVLDVLSDSNEELIISDIQKKLKERGYSHEYNPIRYTLKNLENAGLIEQNGLRRNRRYHIKEWHQRLGAAQAMHIMIMKWIDPGSDAAKHFHDMIQEERIEIEYLWVHGLFRVYARLVDILKDRGIYDEEDDPVKPLYFKYSDASRVSTHRIREKSPG